MAQKKKSSTKKNNSNKQGKKKQSVFLTTLIIIALIFGAGGYFTFHLMTQNDEFTIIGEKTITLSVGDDYEDEGAKIISFGKDRQGTLRIESTVDTEKAGEYYVKYSSTDYRYKNVVRYRYVIVEEVGE